MQLRLLYPWLEADGIAAVRVDGFQSGLGLESLELDALVVQRLSGCEPNGQALVTAATVLGLPMFLDIDDDFLALSRERGHQQAEEADRALETFLEQLAMYEGVWASTPAICTVVSELGVPARLRPTLPPAAAFRRFDLSADRRSGLPFLYHGTTTHSADWAMIEPAVALLRDSGLVVRLVGVVDEAPHLENVLWSQGNARVGSRYLAYLDWLGRLGPFSVGLAPLRPTKFNCAKSSIKVLEYGALGLLPLASDTPAYRILGQWGFPELLVADGSAAWMRQIQKLLDLPSWEQDDLRKSLNHMTRIWTNEEFAQMIKGDLEAITAGRSFEE